MKKENLPSAIDIEESLLGAILIDNSVLEEVTALLGPDCFYDSNNRMLYKIILGMYDKGSPVDTLTVYDLVKKKDLHTELSLDFINSLSNNISSSANATYHAKILKEKWIYRQLILKSRGIIDLATKQSDDAFELLDKAEENISSIVMDMNKVQSNETLWDNFYNYLGKIEDKLTGKADSGLTSSTFPGFNRMTGGMQQGDLITVYGTSKAGKTSLALQLCLDVVLDRKLSTAVISLEMTKENLFNKAASMRTKFDYNKLRNPKVYGLKQDEFNSFMERAKKIFEGSQLFLYDQIFDRMKIKAKLKELKTKFDIQLAVIDYISLIDNTVKRERRDLEVADLSRYFKLLAKELQIPIIMLSQANENGATADSKALQRDSDFCLLVQKPLDEGISSAKLKDGSSFTFTSEHYLITLKKSRHTQSLSQFVCKYVNNNFVEVELYKQEPLFNKMKEVI